MAAKINMRLDKNEMPSQDPNVRNKNFLEVALGYTEEQALDEAARCLNCKNHPCVDGPDFDGHKVDWDLAVKRNQMYKDFEAHKYEETCNLFKKEAE